MWTNPEAFHISIPVFIQTLVASDELQRVLIDIINNVRLHQTYLVNGVRINPHAPVRKNLLRLLAVIVVLRRVEQSAFVASLCINICRLNLRPPEFSVRLY
jgi:hypothetical protein